MLDRAQKRTGKSDDALLFERVAGEVAALIDRGALRPGDRLPSVRKLSRDRSVSVATVIAAYTRLECEGRVEARPKSGHFVRRTSVVQSAPAQRPPRLALSPARVSVSSGVAALVESMRDPAVVPLGAAMVAPELLPIRALNRILASLAREMSTAGASYVPPPGVVSLRRQLAKRGLSCGLSLDEDDFVITIGAMEGLHLALRAVTKPGDTIAVASPTYFGLLQLAEEMNLRVIEIPSRPRFGLDVDALEMVLDQAPVKACLAVANFDNPLGALMSDEDKARMVELLERHEVPLIEDDIYGDLGFDGSRPRPAKAFDRAGRVILCGSASKTIAAGYRVGWVAAGRYQPTIERLKFSQTVATPTLMQMAIAEYLASGAYDRHLRHLRSALASQVQRYRAAIASAFPPGTRISEPLGGFVLWVELPGTISALELQAAALARGIAIAPGPIFGARPRYRSALRITCGSPWSPRMESAIAELGELAYAELARSSTARA
ncbi:MAG: PLP-dependent aminotransferase family protein [Polyangiaceae bacterium]